MSTERPVPPKPARKVKGVPQDRDRTRWDSWYVARAQEQARILFSFSVDPFDGIGEDAIAKVVLVDRYGLFLQFAEFSAWISKSIIVGCRTYTGE